MNRHNYKNTLMSMDFVRITYAENRSQDREILSEWLTPSGVLQVLKYGNDGIIFKYVNESSIIN